MTLLKRLQKVLNALEKHKIPYWLDGGILLGIYRDKKLIEGDSDLDIGIYVDTIKNPKKKKQLINLLKDLNWSLLLDQESRLKFKHNTSNTGFDFWIFNKANEFYWHRAWGVCFYFKLECLNTLTKFKCNDFNYFIPSNPETYLADLYGEQWRIPNPNFKKPEDYKNTTINLKLQ